MKPLRHPSQTHGAPSPADGRKDLGEARTAHNRAVLPQEPGKADNQPYIPGLHQPVGWLSEQFHEGYDIQSGDCNGRYGCWEEKFSFDKPTAGRTVRNIRPVFTSPTDAAGLGSDR